MRHPWVAALFLLIAIVLAGYALRVYLLREHFDALSIILAGVALGAAGRIHERGRRDAAPAARSGV